MSRCFDMNRKMLREESIYLGYIKAAVFCAAKRTLTTPYLTGEPPGEVAR